MKLLSLLNAAGNDPLPVAMDETPSGMVSTQTGLLKNMGDQDLTSVRVWIEQDPIQPGTLSAVVNGVIAGAAPTELLTGGDTLTVGESLSVTLSWSNPADNGVEAEDQGVFRWDVF
ncbi:hypothetical protein [Deinococcus sp. QL22]|uniref:hypothetical protein n=1 Tax=Deinococcus sp. QL22 TaxID=2939437 RepID=UPI002017F323|nr:hypothetical protein [Deinococcus sp. QL22]UQN06277.1 hypothetical protein M1R55_15675 [Deinococcus sp. QL22]